MLNLAGNKIRRLQGAELCRLEALTELNLRRNRLEVVEGPFASLASLQRLFLSHNNFQSIRAVLPAVAEVKQLEELSIEQNPFATVDALYRGQVRARSMCSLYVNLSRACFSFSVART